MSVNFHIVDSSPELYRLFTGSNLRKLLEVKDHSTSDTAIFFLEQRLLALHLCIFNRPQTRGGRLHTIPELVL